MGKKLNIESSSPLTKSWLRPTTGSAIIEPSKPVEAAKSTIQPADSNITAISHIQKPLSKKSISATSGLKKGYMRATVITKIDLIEKVKAYAYWERLKINQAFDLILSEFLKGKDVKPIPAEKKGE